MFALHAHVDCLGDVLFHKAVVTSSIQFQYKCHVNIIAIWFAVILQQFIVNE